MMAARRVIIVKEAQDLSRTISQLLPYVENPSQTTILVLCYKYGKIDGKTKLAKELKKYVCLESKKLYEILTANFKTYNDKSGGSVAFVKNCSIMDEIQMQFLYHD